MPFPEPPEKIVPFSSGQAAPYDIERQFDEHINSFRKLVNFLKEVIRDDGMLRNGKVGPEQLTPEIEEGLARRALAAVETLLEEARAEARLSAASALEMRTLLDKIREREHQIAQAATAMQQALHETRERLNELSALAASSPAPAPTATPAGALGPPYATSASGIPAFYGLDQGADQTASTAVSSDYAQVAMEWAEHMPDTIPPNILAINSITGQHWSARWWATQANNAFGMLQDLYLGVSATPPTTNLTGGPITVGSIYYDTTNMMPYVWSGTAWEAFFAPQKAATASLYYVATANQAAFPVTVTDIVGNTGQLVDEGVMIYLNGVRLTPYSDYSVDVPSDTVTLARAQPAGAMVAIDILTPADELRPGAVLATMLADITSQQDGARTQFQLLVLSTNAAAAVQAPEHMIVSYDGVIQKPGVQYTVQAPNQITFQTAPAVDSAIFMVWLEPPT